MSLWCDCCAPNGKAVDAAYSALTVLLKDCVESLAGYRRELGDGQPCDAEKAARWFLALPVPELPERSPDPMTVGKEARE